MKLVKTSNYYMLLPLRNPELSLILEIHFMKKITLALASFLLFLACGQNPSTGKDGWTVNEAKGIREITATYGGKVNFTKTTSPDSGKSYFHAELSESKVIENQIDLTGMFASHVAWLFFKNLAEEKNQYDGVEVTVKLSTGEAPTFQYPIAELAMVKNRMPVLEKTVELLKAADFDGLHALIAPERAASMPKETIVLDCGSLDKNNGKVTGFQFQGYEIFTPSSSQTEFLHLAGLLKRERYDTPLSIFVDPASQEIQGAVQYLNFDY